VAGDESGVTGKNDVTVSAGTMRGPRSRKRTVSPLNVEGAVTVRARESV
jgi:hypothetical protein